MNAGMCLHFSRSHGLYVFILHTGLDSRAPKVKICCWYPIKGKWGLCRDAERAPSLAKLADRSVQTCWCSHLPNKGCGNEHLYGRRSTVLSQWMDRESLLALPFVWLVPVNTVHPKTEVQMPRPGWGCVGWCYGDWGEGGPMASPVETLHRQPQPCNIKLRKNHSQILCKTLFLETPL